MDIGIDLGTTFSVIAVKGNIALAPGYQGAEYLEDVDVTILPSPTGNLTIPSVMWWHPDAPDEYLFGDEAKQMAEEGKSPIMFSKRSIGTQNLLMLNERPFTAKEVAERFLRYMKEWAETVTAQKVDRVVVTHPAYFTPMQREETMLAALGAGFDMRPEQLVMEPCAAALAYTVNDSRDPLRVMSYDLGGGTFDVAVMEKIGGVVQVRKFHGDHLLGGYNFDRALVQWILDELKAKGKTIPYDETNAEHVGRRSRMLQVAEAVKIRLAEQSTNKVPVPVQVDFLVDDRGQRVQFRGQINREQYAALIREELDRTIACCRAALEGAGMSPTDLHTILLVGGSTKGRWVLDAVAKEFGIVSEPYYPDLCVAAGAALCAAQLAPPPKTTSRVTLSLDYPANSVLRSVIVAGTLTPTNGSDLTIDACRSLAVQLEAPDGSVLGPADIGPEGQFVFRNVGILDDGAPSHFRVVVTEAGNALIDTTGTILYVEENPPPPPPPPVLPRPLFLKAERMVAMADEGAQLPAKCQVKLRRTFGGPTLDIPIYMESEPVGTVRVEDIPDEAGEGCMVVVDVEITQSNEMRGKVQVYGPNNKTVVKTGDVRISFPPIVIPPTSELRGRFDELKDQLEMDILHVPPQDRARLAGPGRALVRKITKLLEGQAPDAQIVHERLKELDRILNPPADDMDPPRREFEGLLAECREQIANNPENTQLKSCSSQLDKVETAGKDAADTKNNKKWKTANDTLQKIAANIERLIIPLIGDGSRETPETPVIKSHAIQRIEEARGNLRSARDARIRHGDIERWEPHCNSVADRLNKMASDVNQIGDDRNKDQAMAQVQSILTALDGLQKKIGKIITGDTIETL